MKRDIPAPDAETYKAVEPIIQKCGLTKRESDFLIFKFQQAIEKGIPIPGALELKHCLTRNDTRFVRKNPQLKKQRVVLPTTLPGSRVLLMTKPEGPRLMIGVESLSVSSAG